MIIRLKNGSISGNASEPLITHGPVYPNIEEVERHEDKVTKIYFNKKTATPGTVLAYKGTSLEEMSKRMNHSGGYLEDHLLYSEMKIHKGRLGDELWEVETISEFCKLLYLDDCESGAPGNRYNRVLVAWALTRGSAYQRKVSMGTSEVKRAAHENRDKLINQVIPGRTGGSIKLQLDNCKLTNFILPMIYRLTSITQLHTAVKNCNLNTVDGVKSALLAIDDYLYSTRLKKNQRLFAAEVLGIPFTSMKPRDTTMRMVFGEDLISTTPVEQVFEIGVKLFLTP